MAQSENIVALKTFRHGEQLSDRGDDAASSPKELAAGTTLLHGQYTLTGYLDSGGFGITYRAIDSLGRSVVVKECFAEALCVRRGAKVMVEDARHAHDFASIVGQFVAEARSLAKLRHRGIVDVHQVFMENETAYIAMEHVDGPSLLTLIEDTRRKFRPTEIEGLALKLLKAIGYVHKRGLLHRDIAPDNILVERGGQPKLIDFGAVRGHDAGSDDGGWQLKCVKDGYSPDEFYDPLQRHGVESDIYSLGATLHHMVTGSAPVDAEMRRRAIEQGQGDPYLPVAGRYRGYTRGFLEALDGALSFKPQDRHASARDWAQSIAKAASLPLTATSAPAPEPLYRERTDVPQDKHSAQKAEPDPMPWIGVAAAAAGAALAFFGPSNVFAFNNGTAPFEITAISAPGTVVAAPPLIATIEPHAPSAPSAFSQPPGDAQSDLPQVGSAAQVVDLTDTQPELDGPVTAEDEMPATVRWSAPQKHSPKALHTLSADALPEQAG